MKYIRDKIAGYVVTLAGGGRAPIPRGIMNQLYVLVDREEFLSSFGRNSLAPAKYEYTVFRMWPCSVKV